MTAEQSAIHGRPQGRAVRARWLADGHPHSAENLRLFAIAFDWLDTQPTPRWEDLPLLLSKLHELLAMQGPEWLRNCQPGPEDLTRYVHEPDPSLPEALTLRLALRQWAYNAPLHDNKAGPNECPRCGHSPQSAIHRQQGAASICLLQCSLCAREWAYRRDCCAQCGECREDRISYHSASEFLQMRTQTCETCGTYMHILLPERDPVLIAEVDELAALPLDVWAVGRGFRKIWPNLAGL